MPERNALDAPAVGPRLFTLAEQRDMATRVTLLEDAIAHVLRYGKVGKQSRRRLKEAINAD